MEYTRYKPLVIRDEVHGDMQFDYLLENVINHESFQRLRHIKQLGLADFVFPCATHTRFQHSLGASYLAGQYFDQMIENWMHWPLKFDDTCGSTRFFTERAYQCVKAVAAHPPSKAYWNQIISLASLLHDIGHGPWSHTFELLNLNRDFREVTIPMKGVVGQYFRELQEDDGWAIKHEDISIIYIYRILKDLAERNLIPDYEMFFLPVATLVNRKLSTGHFYALVQKELQEIFEECHIEGGLDFHRLLRPIISGPFDVDRMDYIQRDGRNCGVNIGGIEWRRIITKLVPCLAEHHGEANEPKDVVLLSSTKNQHVLDDFIFSLFQMYTQVYLHPKIVGLEKLINEKLEQCDDLKRRFLVTYEVHRMLTDEKLKELFIKEYHVPDVENILLRRRNGIFEVSTHAPVDSELQIKLNEEGFTHIEGLDRPMMKDSMGVFLYTSVKAKDDGRKDYVLKNWTEVSPIAQRFYSVNYSPNFWMRQKINGAK